MSVTIRIDGRGGKTYSFWAWYSFKMSFWIVPPSRRLGTPRLVGCSDVHGEQDRRRRVDRHRGRDLAEIDAAEEVLHVSEACRPPRRNGRPRLLREGRRSRGPSSVGRSKATERPSLPERAARGSGRWCPPPSRIRRTCASSRASSGTWRQMGLGCTGTGPATATRAARRRARAAVPTWSRSRASRSGAEHTAPARRSASSLSSAIYGRAPRPEPEASIRPRQRLRGWFRRAARASGADRRRSSGRRRASRRSATGSRSAPRCFAESAAAAPRHVRPARQARSASSAQARKVASASLSRILRGRRERGRSGPARYRSGVSANLLSESMRERRDRSRAAASPDGARPRRAGGPRRRRRRRAGRSPSREAEVVLGVARASRSPAGACHRRGRSPRRPRGRALARSGSGRGDRRASRGAGRRPSRPSRTRRVGSTRCRAPFSCT